MATLSGNTIILSPTELNYTLSGTTSYDIKGNTLANRLTGNAGNNKIYGFEGNDVLIGNGGNDTLYSGTGVDTLIGGTGDDVYQLGSANAVIQESTGQGHDVVYLLKQDNDYYLPNNVEDLHVTAPEYGYHHNYGNAMDNVMTGQFGHALHGGDGNDHIEGVDTLQAFGDAGDDIVIVSAETGWTVDLRGGEGNDYLKFKTISLVAGTPNAVMYGEDGNDTFDVTEANVFQIYGGAGDDTFVFGESGPYYFYLVEDENGGSDTVVTASSFSLTPLNSGMDPHYLSPVNAESCEVEKIILTGSANLDCSGNAGSNNLAGNSGDNVLISYGGNDTLDGGAGNDVLMMLPNQEINVTANPTGVVEMTGGLGDDIFRIGLGYVGNHAKGTNQHIIQDFTQGADKIEFTFESTATLPTSLATLSSGPGASLAGLMDLAASGNSSTTNPVIVCFTFAGDTYLVLDQGSNDVFNDATDLAIKLTGTPGVTFSDLGFIAL